MLGTAVACSSSTTADTSGAEGGAPTESPGPSSPSAEGGADGATGSAAIDFTIDGFRDLYGFYQINIPKNPDLTKTIPASAWHGKSGCLAREPYWRASQNELTYGPSESFTYVGASGKGRIALAFGAGNTVLMHAVLDYTSQLEIKLGAYVGYDKSCDQVRSSLLNYVVVGDTGPFQERHRCRQDHVHGQGRDVWLQHRRPLRARHHERGLRVHGRERGREADRGGDATFRAGERPHTGSRAFSKMSSRMSITAVMPSRTEMGRQNRSYIGATAHWKWPAKT